MTLSERLRKHVQDRGGLAKDEDGNVVLPNGAWAMMLEAADMIDRMEEHLLNQRRNDYDGPQ